MAFTWQNKKLVTTVWLSVTFTNGPGPQNLELWEPLVWKSHGSLSFSVVFLRRTFPHTGGNPEETYWTPTSPADFLGSGCGVGLPGFTSWLSTAPAAGLVPEPLSGSQFPHLGKGVTHVPSSQGCCGEHRACRDKPWSCDRVSARVSLYPRESLISRRGHGKLFKTSPNDSGAVCVRACARAELSLSTSLGTQTQDGGSQGAR